MAILQGRAVMQAYIIYIYELILDIINKMKSTAIVLPPSVCLSNECVQHISPDCVLLFRVVRAMEIEHRVAKWTFKIRHRNDPTKDHYFSCNSENEMKVAKCQLYVGLVVFIVKSRRP